VDKDLGGVVDKLIHDTTLRRHRTPVCERISAPRGRGGATEGLNDS